MALTLIVIGGLIYFLLIKKQLPVTPLDQSTPIVNNESDKSVPVNPVINETQNEVARWVAPLDRSSERITKKKYGQYIDPQSSPVQPEKFRGFHTGVDWEVFPDELEQGVTIKAVCTGRVLVKEKVEGYGGVVVTSCVAEGQPITVLYGHLKLDSINWKEWDQITAGEVIGQLGAEYSADTAGERKHLHLGFHLGEQVNYLGYVQRESELKDWIDPCEKLGCLNQDSQD